MIVYDQNQTLIQAFCVMIHTVSARKAKVGDVVAIHGILVSQSDPLGIDLLGCKGFVVP